MTELNYKELGQRIKKYRIAAHLTQQSLAERIECNTSNISHIERGMTKVSLPTLIKIANALNVSMDELISNSLIATEGVMLDKDIQEILKDCNSTEKRIIKQIMQATKLAIRNK